VGDFKENKIMMKIRKEEYDNYIEKVKTWKEEHDVYSNSEINESGIIGYKSIDFINPNHKSIKRRLIKFTTEELSTIDDNKRHLNDDEIDCMRKDIQINEIWLGVIIFQLNTETNEIINHSTEPPIKSL
jgi:hypothetical protein